MTPTKTRAVYNRYNTYKKRTIMEQTRQADSCNTGRLVNASACVIIQYPRLLRQDLNLGLGGSCSLKKLSMLLPDLHSSTASYLREVSVFKPLQA